MRGFLALLAACVAVGVAVVVLFWPGSEPLPKCWLWVPPFEQMVFTPDPLCRATHPPPPLWLYDPMFAPPE